MLQATMTGALARVVGTTLALWLPLVPLYLFVRHAISSRSPSRWACSNSFIEIVRKNNYGSPQKSDICHWCGRAEVVHPAYIRKPGG